jgi:hypothetical protein
MAKPTLTAEQAEHFEKHIAGIGHNLWPTLQEHADEIQAKAAEHNQLKAYATEIRVMFDMMRSHLSGERLLPDTTLAFVFGGLSLVAVMTTVGVVTAPISTLLLDGVVLAFTTASIHGDIQEYIDWRAPRDPSYQEVRRELAGKTVG